MNGYELSRNWFDWSFENPEKINPNHSALYFFCIEHCNRLGWKEKFGLPTTMAKESIGIKSYNTYIKTFNDLIEWGFIILIQKSTNQYSANIIALSINDKAFNKALDKAMIKHELKQSESINKSIDSIDKHITINNKPINNIDSTDIILLKKETKPKIFIDERKDDFKFKVIEIMEKEIIAKGIVKEFFEYWTELNPAGTKMKFEFQQTFEISRRLNTWIKNSSKFNKTNTENNGKSRTDIQQEGKDRFREKFNKQNFGDGNRD